MKSSLFVIQICQLIFFYKYIFGTPGREDEESVAEKHDLQEISHIVIFSFTNDH